MTTDPAKIRAFVADKRALCNEGHFIADRALARVDEALSSALDIIEALLAERERNAPAIQAAVRFTASAHGTRCHHDGITALESAGLIEAVEGQFASWRSTDLGRAVCNLAERMEAGDAG